jgi:cell division protein FtsZ
MKDASHASVLPDGQPERIDLYQTSIRVLGAGGAGNNTIDRLQKMGIRGVDTIALNTDAQQLLETHANRRILIGKNITAGLGSGGDPQIGERSAEENHSAILSAIEGTDLLFITGGLGGGTATGSIPIIGRLAREQGTLTMAVVTMPFSEEGIVRWENAQIGLEKIRKSVDTVIVLRNDKLHDLYPDTTLLDAFRKADEILIHSLIGLSDLVQKRGLINLDFADIRSILTDGPNAVVGLGESRSENRAEEAARRAFSHPMMDTDVAGAQSAMVHITGGPDLTLKESRQVIHALSRKLDPGAKIIWGVTIDKSLKGTLKVLLIVTGLVEKEDDFPKRVEETESAPRIDSGAMTPAFGPLQPLPDDGKSIFDIKESIMASGEETTTLTKPKKAVAQSSQIFYTIFEEEAAADLKRFDRAVHLLRETPDSRKALLDALQSCKMLFASAQMFGFDETCQLLGAVQDILQSVHAREIQMNTQILDSVTLAIEMVVDLMENRCDGRGETGYIVDRLRDLRGEQLGATADAGGSPS